MFSHQHHLSCAITVPGRIKSTTTTQCQDQLASVQNKALQWRSFRGTLNLHGEWRQLSFLHSALVHLPEVCFCSGWCWNVSCSVLGSLQSCSCGCLLLASLPCQLPSGETSAAWQGGCERQGLAWVSGQTVSCWAISVLAAWPSAWLL